MQEIKAMFKQIAKTLTHFVPSATKKPKVLIDAGHSDTVIGARGINPEIKEEDLNKYQAIVLKQELEKLGIDADIVEDEADRKYQIGRLAKGYNAFVSLHLNAANGKEHYTCALIHSTKQTADSLSAKIASEWAQACAKAIGNKLPARQPAYPLGVLAAPLAVLSGAVDAKCPICFVSELEFIDDETDINSIKARIDLGMRIGASVLARYLKSV